MSGKDGTIYLLHFSKPFKHARHYLGWASNLEKRLAAHEAGNGARLLQVVKDAGITWKLARTWQGDKNRERQLKNMGNRRRRCPECGVKPRKEKEKTMPTKETAAKDTWVVCYEHAAGPFTADRAERERTSIEKAGRCQDQHEIVTSADRPVTEAEARAKAGEEAKVRRAQAERSGAETADQIIIRQADAGMDADAIDRHHDGIISSLLTDAETDEGRSFAQGYAANAETYVSDLKRLDRPEPGRTPGAPHLDPGLAARGRQAGSAGIYERQRRPEHELEAG